MDWSKYMAKRRTDNEWMAIIQECKSSGYTDSDWCKRNNISASTFYTKLKGFRKNAAMDEPVKAIIREKQEVVQVTLQEEPKLRQYINNDVALRLNVNGVTIEILNNATKATIENTLHSLRSLC